MPFHQINGVHFHHELTGDGPPLTLLHGFTGSLKNWSLFVHGLKEQFTVLTVDLLGHGRTDVLHGAGRYGMIHAAADLIALIDETFGAPSHLLGYSMGGRLALYTAIHYPEKITSLILESTSPGLMSHVERMQRQQQDNALADRIERDGIEAFVDYWQALPLFASQQRLAPDIRSALRHQRLRNRPAGLANSLRGMGTGVQPSLWDQLHQLNLPVLLLAGELDTKFVGIAQQMYDLLPDAQLVVVPDAGHTVHLEQPAAFQSAVMTFLRGSDAGR